MITVIQCFRCHLKGIVSCEAMKLRSYEITNAVKAQLNTLPLHFICELQPIIVWQKNFDKTEDIPLLWPQNITEVA
jgi:hypothetical protein